MNDISDFVKVIRNQRHDFMNHLQIIYGYIQIGKIEEAKEYINNLSEKNAIISCIYNLEDDFLALCLQKNLEELWKKEIKVSLDTEMETIGESVFREDYYKKCNLVNNIFSDMENNNLNFVYINIFEDEMGRNLFIANREELIDEISWMEEWQMLPTDIEGVRLYKCNYENNLAYRLAFVK